MKARLEGQVSNRGSFLLFLSSPCPPSTCSFAEVAQLDSRLRSVYGRAQGKVDSGVIRFLGVFNDTADCAAACISYTRPSGDKCHSYTHHHATFPGDWKGFCFALADHSWQCPTLDTSDPPIISSGRVGWPQQPCGATSAPGCSWQIDPWCLDGSQQYEQSSLTTAQAATKCASDSQCVGFSLQNGSAVSNASSVQPTLHTFFNGSSGNPGGCWTYRRSFDLDADPYRTTFHFQPPSNWMSEC